MAFSPSVYGERAATVLNTLVERDDLRGERGVYHDVKYHTMTEPEGTLLEADILLTCSNNGITSLYRTLRYVNPKDDLFNEDEPALLRLFQDPTQYQTMLDTYHKTHPRDARRAMVYNVQKSVVDTILECRGSIRQIAGEDKPQSSSPVFGDGLFGPHVAKVMNSLLEAEIEFTEVNPPLLEFPSYTAHNESARQTRLLSLVLVNEHSQERRSFALHSGKGTAFAGDILVQMHCTSYNHDKFQGDSPVTQKVREALFPEFELTPHGRKTVSHSCIYQALQNVRLEMDFVFRIVHGEALPVLMAGIPRLGSESILNMVDKELLCMIVRLAIFE
jgi:hypothetical protein